MDFDTIQKLFEPIYSDIRPEDQFAQKKPFLAHYTSLEVLEKILTTNEIWFSNPLFMNDLEEVRFGFLNGAKAIRESNDIRKVLGDTKYALFIQAFDHYILYFEQEHLLDTYVFCLTEQAVANTDGLLSMWRGYGGNGKGAALVFDTSKLGAVEDSPLILSQVVYGSASARNAWLAELAKKVAQIFANNIIPDDKIHLASHAIYQRLKLFALFTKHVGFKEENEWRAVYLSDRDIEKKFQHMLGYAIGPRGVEPKLKFKLEPIPGLTALDLSFEKILALILLGPSTSSPLALRSVKRMLDVIKKPALKDRVVASTIPLRPL